MKIRNFQPFFRRGEKMKKGMIEVQFNWIFILIVGAIILMFFVGVTLWYKDNEERKIAADIMSKLKAATTGASVSSRTASEMEIPKIGLLFTCDPDECSDYGCSSGFQFEGVGIPKDTSMDILFTQNKIESDFLHTWTQEWKTPYKVTNFLYFSSPSTSFNIIHDAGSQAFAEEVFSTLRKNSFVTFGVTNNPGAIQYRNEELVRYVYFFNPANPSVSPSVLQSRKWDYIVVDGTIDVGTVTFYKPGQTTGKSYQYVGLPSLIGAIYSEDYDLYVCNMKKAYLKLNLVNKSYKKRTELLDSAFPSTHRCSHYYGASVTSEFDNIDSASDHNAPNVAGLRGAMVNLEDKNRLTVINTCPRIY